MIGIILLFISFVLYFKPRYRYISYFLYISFMLGYGGGFGLWTDEVLGIKNKDMAIVYTFVISLYLISQNNYKLPKIEFLKWYKLFIIFIFCSIVFSYIHYGFSFYQILQGGRDYLLIFSLPILMKIKVNELSKLMNLLLCVTIITSILFILQIVVGHPLMPYSGEPSIDPTVGLTRMYNSPALLDFFLIFTFVKPEYFGKRVNLLRILFFITLICTFGRTGIFSTIISVLLAMMFLGKASKMIKTIVIIGILFIPFIGMVTSRFEKGGTSDDLSAIKSGNYQNFEMGEGGTMTYRIAWVYERFDYLTNRSIGEQIFGLGLISESQPIVNKMYNFRVGNIVQNTGFPTQLYTPDIAYGNILTKLGLVGSSIYLLFVISLTLFFYKYRKTNYFTIICSAQIIMLFIGSFSGSSLSEPKNLIIYFVVIGTIYNIKKFDPYNNAYNHGKRKNNYYYRYI